MFSAKFSGFRLVNRTEGFSELLRGEMLLNRLEMKPGPRGGVITRHLYTGLALL